MDNLHKGCPNSDKGQFDVEHILNKNSDWLQDI